jgi:hypothetical protein
MYDLEIGFPKGYRAQGGGGWAKVWEGQTCYGLVQVLPGSQGGIPSLNVNFRKYPIDVNAGGTFYSMWKLIEEKYKERFKPWPGTELKEIEKLLTSIIQEIMKKPQNLQKVMEDTYARGVRDGKELQQLKIREVLGI